MGNRRFQSYNLVLNFISFWGQFGVLHILGHRRFEEQIIAMGPQRASEAHFAVTDGAS